jgi:diaminopimelate epimerase
LSLEFIKISATGNDFILIDNRSGRWEAQRDAAFFSRLCRHRLRIGADGVILLEESGRADFRFVHINSDGSLAGMCGNGSRAIAWFATLLGIGGGRPTFEINERIYQADVRGLEVTTAFVPPGPADLDCDIVGDPGMQAGGFIDTGVPHYVIFVQDAAAVDVAGRGSWYRHHAAFPAGANIDFVAPAGAHDLNVRTFERGVEAETLACGTGAVASSIISHHRGLVLSPVTVHFPGGDVTVAFDDSHTRVTLSGTVTPVYAGTLLDLS